MREGIAVVHRLEQSYKVKLLSGLLHTNLADVLRNQEKFVEARDLYEHNLRTNEEMDDTHGQGVTLNQLGNLALREGKPAEALKYFQKALGFAQRLQEPLSEALTLNNLGLTFSALEQWKQAEQHYRESASLSEKHGDFVRTAGTWFNLAALNKATGNPEGAESWYRKAIESLINTGDFVNASKALYGLADLLQDQPERLAEARQLAEGSLDIMKTLDLGTAEIWTTYTLLAQIADNESEPDKAAEYRRLAREAKRNFAGTAHEMKQFAPLIAVVVGAVAGNDETTSGVNQLMEGFKQGGGESVAFAKSIERILAGERDAEALCSDLGSNPSMIIETILEALEDPSILQDLLPEDSASE